MKLLKVIGIVLVIFIVLIGVYSRILQAHADESQRIFDDRCNNVNPVLIKYKQAYLDMVNLMKTDPQPKSEPIINLYNQYLDGIRAYLPLEKSWLEKQRTFVNRWDFQTFEPKYMKDLAIAQTDMYQAYFDHAKSIIDIADNQSTNSATVEKDNLYIASDKYFRLQDEATNLMDWRKLLWKEPPVNCPEKNLEIPETGGALEKIFGEPTPEPEFMPNSPNS